MNKKYFHEITDEEFSKLVEEKRTNSYVSENYKQPDWCCYPDALDFNMGCWSLTDIKHRKDITIERCKTCDCFKQKHE